MSPSAGSRSSVLTDALGMPVVERPKAPILEEQFVPVVAEPQLESVADEQFLPSSSCSR